LLILALVMAVFAGVAYMQGKHDLAQTDSDRDGLPNVVEESGWRALRGGVFFTNPYSADTDGDELTDGEEAGRLIVGFPWAGIHAGDSDPTKVDSDGEGVDDATERDGGFDPWSADSDEDALNDFAEIEFGSDPLSRNADGDHLDDAEELEQGADPNTYDLTSSEAWLALAGGVVFGDWVWGARNIERLNDAQLESWQYLAGSIAGGFVAIGDVRDLLADVGDQDWGAALLDLAAVIPVLGDGAKVTESVMSFVKRGGRATTSAMYFVATNPALDDVLKRDLVRQIVRQNPEGARLARDVAVRGKSPPQPLSLRRAISRSATQNARKDEIVLDLQRRGFTEIRVNQQQVNAAGLRVGTNRPDIQATAPDGTRHYYELDATSSTRGPGHMVRILSNDDQGEVYLIVQD
jgi:hypothetical protein